MLSVAEAGALPAAVTWKIKFPEPVRVEDPELTTAVTPAGRLEGIVKLMVPTNPGRTLTAMVAVPVKPRGTLMEAAEALNVFGGGTTLKLTFSVRVIEPNAAVTVTFCSPVNPSGAPTVSRDVPLEDNDEGEKTAVTPLVPEAVRVTGPVKPVPNVTV
jgi:hypothetical protein